MIPLKDLIGKCRVIDIQDKCLGEESSDYCLSVDDIISHELSHGIIEHRSIVLIRTGWWRHYREGAIKYLGFDAKIHGTYDV